MIINNNLQSITGAYCLNGKNKNKNEISFKDINLSDIEKACKAKVDILCFPLCLDCANFINGPQFIGGKAKCSVYDEIPDKIFWKGGCCTSFKSKKSLKIF